VFSAEGFSSENDMLTPSMKVKRGPIEARFQREIDAAASVVASASAVSAELDDTFLLQGGDSLSAVKLVAKIKRQFGTDVPVTFLLQNPSLEQLKDYVQGKHSNKPPSLPKSALDDLTCDVRAHLGPVRGQRPVSLAEAECVLLTGATGFLGSYLLRDLLKALPKCRVVCIVRGDKQRLENTIKSRELGVIDWERVEVIGGDLEQGLLGLGSVKAFNDLCRRVDAVFHSAASVNWMLSYDALRPANVAPCFDLIRFCTTQKPKRLFHISTVSCCPARPGSEGRGMEYYEGFGDDDWITSAGPYAQSKYVAEKIFAACYPDLQVSLFRPANIMADTSTGVANLTDFSNRLVACSVELQVAIAEDVVSNFTPVNYVSESIVRIANSDKCALGPYLLTNNNSPTLLMVADAIIDAFPSVKRVSYQEFRKILLEHLHPEKLSIFGLLPMFGPRLFLYDSVAWSDCSNTLLLEEASSKTSFEDLKKWIGFLKRCKFV
jgi:thioester reductase-like protein